MKNFLQNSYSELISCMKKKDSYDFILKNIVLRNKAVVIMEYIDIELRYKGINLKKF